MNTKFKFFTMIYFHKFRKTFDQPQCMSLPLLLSLSLTISFSVSLIPHTHSLRIYEASPFAFRSFCLIPFINRSCSFLKLHYTLLLPREDVVHVELSCCIVEFSYLFLPIQYQWNSYQFPRLSRLSNRLTRD